MIFRPIWVLMLPLTLAACASDPAPLEQLRLTEQTLSQAQTSGVSLEQSPTLQQAQHKLSAAQAAMAEQDYKQARIYAEQAELDARLAESQQLTEKSTQQLVELTTSINRLRKQLGGLQ